MAAVQGRPERAVTLAGAAARLRKIIGRPAAQFERDRLDVWLERCRQTLPPQHESAAWTKGQAFATEDAINYALEEDEPA